MGQYLLSIYTIFVFMCIRVFGVVNRKILSAQLTQMPCDMSVSFEITWNGSAALDDTLSLTTSAVSLGGWIYPRGYSSPDFYTLFSFHEAFIPYPVYAISYSSSSRTFREQLGSPTTNYAVPQFTSAEWLYVLSFVEYKSANSTFMGGTIIWKTDSTILLKSFMLSTTFHISDITKSSLELNFGYSKLAFAPTKPACALTKYICAFNAKVNENEASQVQNDFQAQGTHLLYHFDNYYMLLNPSKLFSVHGKSEDAILVASSNSNPFYIASSQSLSTNYINSSENGGFTIIFYIKTYTTTFTLIRILTVIENIGYVDFVQIAGANISLSGIQSIASINFSNWLEIIVVIKFGISNVMHISERNNHANNVLIPIPQSYARTLRVIFGSPSNTDAFTLNNIRIFSGVYVFMESNLNCFFTMYNGGFVECLTCNTNYLLDVQKIHPRCEQSTGLNSDLSFPFLLNWSPTRSLCSSPKMIHNRPSSSTCRCRFQSYFDGSQCKLCPRYCNGCYDLTGLCINQTFNRSPWLGTCPVVTFDNGYSCKQKDNFIPGGVNVIKEFQFGAGMSQTLNDAFLQLNSDQDFLMTFTFHPNKIGFLIQAIFTLSINSVEISTIVLQSIMSEITAILYINGLPKWLYRIHETRPTWFAFSRKYLASLTKTTTTLFILTNGVLESITVDTSVPISPITTEVCFGKCPSVTTGGLSFLQVGTLNDRPLRYIKNPNFARQNSDEILSLLCDDFSLIAFFRLQLKIYTSDTLGAYQSVETPGKYLDFKLTSVVLTDQLKGFGFRQNGAVASVDVGKLEVPVSFSTWIYIETMITQITLLSYEFDKQSQLKIEYYLVPSESTNSVSVRICVGFECQDTNELGMNLYMLERNFLAILPQDLSPFSLEYMRIAFKIYCNYEKETITFYRERPPPTPTAQKVNAIVSIGLQSEQTNQYQIFLNRIQFMKGNMYSYEDRTDSDPCYLSMDSLSRISSICLLPKKGNVLKSDNTPPISRQQCEDINAFPTIHFVNEYTLECLNSEQLESECIEIDYNTLTCKTCKEGYFLKFHGFQAVPQVTCEICDPLCATCVGDSMNCVRCQTEGIMIPPACLCDMQGFFLDASYQCVECDSRCETCFGTANNCLTCSLSRVSPPLCPCDISMVEVTPTGTLNSLCVPNPCNNPCLTCTSIPSNCLSCKENRENPPFCNCKPGSLPNADGTCTFCPKGMRFDSSLQTCSQCMRPCMQCTQTLSECTECEAGLTLYHGECFCSGGQQVIIQASSLLLFCAIDMNVSFSLETTGRNQYVLVFTFEHDLHSIDFNLYPIASLLFVYLNEVPANLFELRNPVISKNQLRVDLIALQSFKATSGAAIFLLNRVFVSINEHHILNRLYLVNPFKFDSIGPLIFSEDTNNKNTIFDVSPSEFKKENEQLIASFQGAQIVFYVFNALQPTALFLLLSISFPPNLYEFLQIIGIPIYPDVQDYQSTPRISSATNQSTMKIASVNESKSQSNHNEQANSSIHGEDGYVLRRLGFSGSAWVSIPVICLKYVGILVLLFLNEVLLQKARVSGIWVKVKSFLLAQILTENEVNLLIASVAILIQFENIDELEWTSRYGVYFMFVTIGVNIFGVIMLVHEIILFKRYLRNFKNSSKSSPGSLILDNNSMRILTDSDSTTKGIDASVDYAENYSRDSVFWQALVSRIKKKRIVNSNCYFLLQIFKKYALIGVIFYLRSFPELVCIFCALIFFLSSITTVCMKPYLKLRSRYVKIIIDFAFSVCWMLHYWIVCIETSILEPNNSQTSSALDEEKIMFYFTLGEATIILLIVMNVGYVLEQICGFVEMILEYLSNRKKAKLEDQKVPYQFYRAKKPTQGFLGSSTQRRI